MELDAIRGEVERIKTQLSKWETEVATLNAKIGPAREELESWNRILQLRLGEPAEQVSLGIQIDEPPKADDMHAGQPDKSAPAEYGAKAKALREFVLSNRLAGVTISDLMQETTRLGSNRNSAYRFVWRLTKAKPPELDKRRNRYFPTEHMKQ